MLLGRVLFAGFDDVVVYWLDDCCLICCLLLISSVVGCCCDLCRVAFALWVWWFGFDWLAALNAVWRWVQLVSVVFVCLLASLLVWLVFGWRTDWMRGCGSSVVFVSGCWWLMFNSVGIVAFMNSFVVFVLFVGLNALVLAGLRCFCGCWFVLFVLIWLLSACRRFRL